MNKKLKRMLATVSSVAMCATSVISMGAGAIGIFKDREVRPETTSFSASIYGEDVKFYLWQKAADYFDGENVKMYISDTFVNHNGEEYTNILVSDYINYYDTIAESWIDYCSLELFCCDFFEFDNKEELISFKEYLSDNNIAYKTSAFGEDTVRIDYEMNDEYFDILQKIKEDTGRKVTVICLENSIQVTDVENAIPEPTLTGDANEDGNITIADSVLILQSLSNPDDYKLTIQGIANADMDGDGVTAADALRIQEMLANK